MTASSLRRGLAVGAELVIIGAGPEWLIRDSTTSNLALRIVEEDRRMVAPVEFPVAGRPPTKKGESKDIWQEAVRKAVPGDAGLLEGPLRMCIDIYLRGEPPNNKLPDVDNMIKTVLDALKGSDPSEGYLYADDTTIEEICARRIDRDKREPDCDEASDALRRALRQWREFVIIRVVLLAP